MGINPSSLNLAQVKATARGNWPHVLMSLGIASDFLTGRHGPCPGCGGRDRFRFDDRNGDGTFICSQGAGEPLAGDGFTLLRHVTGDSLNHVVQRVVNCLGGARGAQGVMAGSSARPVQAVGPVSMSPEHGRDEQKRYQRLASLWKQARPLNGTDPASEYLSARGLHRQHWPDALRFVAKLPYYEQIEGRWKLLGEYPAMLARIQDFQGNGVGLHRTYLSLERGEKLQLRHPVTGEHLPAKKAMPPVRNGALNGAAVRLDAPSDGRLMVAEGIETALAAGQLSGWPVWSCVSANGLSRLQLPGSVREVVIAADNDVSGTGQNAALSLARRLALQGYSVRIIPTLQAGRDWADVLKESQDV